MKKNYLFALLTALCIFAASGASAQVTTMDVRDSISTNTHWTCDKQYLLHGYVYVTSGATLTIDAGVIIRGDKNSKGSLIVERGAQIYANGTETAPIVFTSNQTVGNRTYGDWGGVILCGTAPVNWTGGQGQVEGGPRSFYGGNNPHDNSGALHYVRIEFAGVAFSPNNEINGLTFCGVGDATQVDHIQVSYSGDDSYEWFGGNVNTKYLIAFRGWDDDFDTDNGYSGFNQYGMGIRDPFAADQSGSKAFESDSYQGTTVPGTGGDTSQITKCVFANYTVAGPMISPSFTGYDGQFVAAAHIRRGSAISILNSLLLGYPAGILIDESSSSYGSTIANLVSGISQIQGVTVAGIPTTNAPGAKEVFFVRDGARSVTPTTTWGDTMTYSFAPYSGPWGWFETPSFQNHIYANAQSQLRLQAPFSYNGTPIMVPTSTSSICYNNTNLPAYITTDIFHNGKKYPYDATRAINTDTTNLFANYNAPDLKPVLSSYKLQNSFFTVANHVGAFNYTGTTADNWASGWTQWDPVNTNYNTVCSSNAIQEYDGNKLYLRVSPNPANNEALIGYRILENTDVTITLTDVLGNTVKEIFSGKSATGEFTTRFETSDIATGIYIVNVKTGNAQQAIKLSIAH